MSSRKEIDGLFIHPIETYHLLCDHSDILEKMRSKVTHIMVDEYQDTNFIQEQLVFLLAGDRKNICVVGDDDQGLYRFEAPPFVIF